MMHPPAAEKKAHIIEAHGDQRTDHYYWLRERENPKVLEYLRQENSYTEQKLLPVKELQKQLVYEMRSRIKEEDQSVPVRRGSYLYYFRYLKGQEYPIYCRKEDRPNSAEEILLDGNKLAINKSYFQFGQIQVSPDQKMIAWSVDHTGGRIYSIHFKDLQSGLTLEQSIPHSSGNLAWAADSRHLFYTMLDPETLRSFQVFRRDLRQPDSDQLVMQEDDETFDISVSLSKTRRYVYLNSTSTLSSEVYYIDAHRPLDKFQSFQEREPKHEYDVQDAGDEFFILTNWQAKNFRLMSTPISQTKKSSWKEVVAHRPDVLIEDIEVFSNFIALEEAKDGLPQIQILNRSSMAAEFIQYDDPTYVAALGDNIEYDTDKLRFEYESLTTPESIFEFDMSNGTRKLLKQKEVLGSFDHSHYLSERIFAGAPDGTRIPISVVYRKDRAQKSGPLLLNAYGSYGLNMDPHFNSNILSLLDRGFVYAIPHIRGGSEMGRQWYEDGKLLKKMNTFTDFISCAEYLIKNSYTAPEHLYATGGSAGGLLMGAVINMRPDLFHGVVARVPFVDVLTTMLDDSIPLTTFEYDEWGNPNDPQFYEYMKSYSPYDNLKVQKYPHLLVTAGLYDSQVQYWEPAKWVSKLRELKTDKNLLLLRTEMEAGHGGKSGRFQRLEETAMIYSFILGLESQALIQP